MAPSTASAIEMVLPQGPCRRAARLQTAGVAVAEAVAGAGARRRGSVPQRRRWSNGSPTTKDKVRGKIVLVGKAAVIPVNFDPPAKRRSDEQVKAQYDPAIRRRPRRTRLGGGRDAVANGSEPADRGAGGRSRSMPC